MNAIQVLLDGLIDYAGLFPPAALSMPAAVSNYAAYRDGVHAWALGRFVVPAARLAELDSAARGLRPFRLSVLWAPGSPQPALGPLSSIDAVEVKLESPGDIGATLRALPDGVTAYCEVPIERDPADWIAALAEAGARAKVRTGGVTPELFPTSAVLARFIMACAKCRLPFKATAGLHHPVRGEHNLTYEPASAALVMHGFINVFLSAALAYHGGTERDVFHTLEERSPEAFRFDDAGVSWHGHYLRAEDIAVARKKFAIGFGSCSFEEPIADLKALGLL